MSKFGDESIYTSLVSVRKEFYWEIDYLNEQITGTYYESDDQREGRAIEEIIIHDDEDLSDEEIAEITEFVSNNI